MIRIPLVLALLAGAIAPALAQQAIPVAPLKEVRVDYMLRGYFYAASEIVDRKALGGFGASLNLPKPLDRNVPGAKAGTAGLIVRTDLAVPFAEEYEGVPVYLYNATDDTLAFDASDSRLEIVMEALLDGEWKPIEYLPRSWCGNSFHTLFLGPNRYWEFAAPRYSGSHKTMLRYCLDREEGAIYSNEFAGSINPEQFTEKQGHTPRNLMDPYGE